MGKGAFKKLTIKNLDFKNKLIMAPISSNQADKNGFPGEFHYIHYGSRAIGSVGAMIVEGTAIDKKGRINDKDLGIWSDVHIKGLKKISTAIKANNVVPGIQLFHGGTSSESEKLDINKMPVKKISHMVKLFKNAAKRAVKAGYELIEINAGNGYLINEFLNVESNKRTDEYGGELKNRARLLIEVVRAMKEVIPEDKILSIRLSVDNFEDESTKAETELLIKILNKEGIDLVDISTGLETRQAIDIRDNLLEGEANVPVLEGGLINIPNESNEIVRKDKSGLRFLGQAILRDSYWLISGIKNMGAKVNVPQKKNMIKSF